MRDNAKQADRRGRGNLWGRHIKSIPEGGYYLTLSCIMGSFFPGTESMIPRVYDLLGVRWGTNPDARSGWTCCTGIAYHGDVMPIEGTLLTVARLWSIAQASGLPVITPVCVTSFGVHLECRDLYEKEPGLKEKIDRLLMDACGRTFEIPKHIIHVSDVFYRYRDVLRNRHFRYTLTEKSTGRPLRVVDHVGCHYSKIFPVQHAIGGAEDCRVLADPVRAWGGEEVDYPERRGCCGMGFRQCMITPNRGATIARTLKKIRSMAPGRPDLIVTNCPGCTTFLDKGQWTIHEVAGESPFIPVLNYVELAGLLLGWDPYEAVGIQFHTVPVEPLLERIGIPFDRSRSSLEGRPYGVGPAFAGPPTAG